MPTGDTYTPPALLGWMERGVSPVSPYLQKACVTWHKPHVMLLQIPTLILRAVEQNSRNNTGAGGEEGPTNSVAHNMVLVIRLPLVSLSPLSHAHTKRLIFGLK